MLRLRYCMAMMQLTRSLAEARKGQVDTIDVTHEHSCCYSGSAALAGHSLGAAVASLSALQLLKQLPAQLHSSVASIGFAGPAFGNAALAAFVEAEGWSERFTNYLLPGDAGVAVKTAVAVMLHAVSRLGWAHEDRLQAVFAVKTVIAFMLNAVKTGLGS